MLQKLKFPFFMRPFKGLWLALIIFVLIVWYYFLRIGNFSSNRASLSNYLSLRPHKTYIFPWLLPNNSTIYVSSCTGLVLASSCSTYHLLTVFPPCPELGGVNLGLSRRYCVPAQAHLGSPLTMLYIACWHEYFRSFPAIV